MRHLPGRNRHHRPDHRFFGVYTNPQHIVAYTDGEIRQQHENIYIGRPIGGEPTINDEADGVRFVRPADLDDYGIHPSMRQQISDFLVGTYPYLQWRARELGRRLFENTGYVVMQSALEARFAARRNALHREFPAYTESHIPQGVIDVLYGASFLGVRRGSDVVYTGGTQVPPLPGEDEFHVHPCFRPALNSLDSVELPAFTPSPRRNAVVIQAGLLNYTAGADVGLSVNRDIRLLGDVVGAGERLLRQLARSGLPEATRQEVQLQIGRVVVTAGEVRAQLERGSSIDIQDHVLVASSYFGSLAAHLSTYGSVIAPSHVALRTRRGL